MPELGGQRSSSASGSALYAVVAGFCGCAHAPPQARPLGPERAPRRVRGRSSSPPSSCWSRSRRSNFGFTYVAQHTSRELPLPYKLASFWGGQEGSLLLWLLVLTGYGGRRRPPRPEGRAGSSIAWVVPVLGVVATFFSMLVVFVASPFHTQLAAGRRGRAEPEPAEPVLPDPPAAPLPRLRRADRPVRVRDGGAPLRAHRRALDRRHAPLDARRLDVPRDRPAARREVGVRGGRLGRLLRLGSGRERRADALARRHRVPALGDGAGAEGDAEGLEHAARHPRVLALAVRDVPDPRRAC